MIVTREQLQSELEPLRASGKNIISTNGVFDILHAGHIRYLTAARRMGDLLIVGINSDNSTRHIKGSERPLNGEHDRAEVLDALRCVDFVTIFDETDPRTLLHIIRPAIHVKGGDYTIDRIIEKETVEAGGGKVILLPPSEGYSTTNIIEKIRQM